VRAGFLPHLRREIAKALKPLHVDRCPFIDCRIRSPTAGAAACGRRNAREMQWVRPKLLAPIRFVEWTAEGRLRHAAFLGLRADKSASQVRRELHS